MELLQHPDLWRGWVFLGGLGAVFAAESFAPARPWRDRRAKRAAFHAALAAFNTALLRLTLVGPLLALGGLIRANGWGLAPAAGLTGAAEILASLVALDFLNYWWHRFNHTLPLLWRFHKVHHVDTHVDVTTSLRFHPGEFIISSGVKALWLLLIGPSLAAFAIFEAATSLAAQFHHGNIDFPDAVERPLRRLIVTPRFHAAHHTVSTRSREANFSTIFIAWDRLFGSYREPDYKEIETLGLPRGRESYLSLKASLAAPFTDSY